jgi:anti-sigma factor RsiW
MTCDQVRDRMPDVAAGLVEPGADETKHIETCSACAEQLKAMRATMSLLDEWQTPEPSPYFDVRLQARLREEMAKPQAGWRNWFRRPVLAAALTVVLGIGVGLFVRDHSRILRPVHQEAALSESAEPGTAVSDLQSLDRNHDLYSDFELLDDLEVQQNVTANP